MNGVTYIDSEDKVLFSLVLRARLAIICACAEVGNILAGRTESYFLVKEVDINGKCERRRIRKTGYH